MQSPFVIDVWSDVVCPFCYLGVRQLQLALARFEHADLVQINHRAFELDSRAPDTYEKTLTQLVARKYDLPVERAASFHSRLEDEAAALGMTWSLASAQPSNTFNAHRLLALASEQDRGSVMLERLFVAYFSEGELLSDATTLGRLAHDVGVTGFADVLATNAWSDHVRADEAAAAELGISGVPSMLVDQKFMVSGSRSPDELLSVLDRAWARREKVSART